MEEAPRIHESYKLAYERICTSYERITEFRAKLLTFLPLATGTGAILLLDRTNSDLLGLVGLFAAVVTAGLFMYEFRGIQRCHRLEKQARTVEQRLGLSAQEGQFLGQPRRLIRGMVGAPAAGVLIYFTVAFAWVYVAGHGFRWWNEGAPVWALGFGYVLALAVGWWTVATTLRDDPPTIAVDETKDDTADRGLRSAIEHAFDDVPAYRRLESGRRVRLVSEVERILAGLVTDAPAAPDLPAFVEDLIRVTFDANVNVSAQQMDAYADLLSHASASIGQFANTFRNTRATRQRQQLLTTMVLMGISRIIVTADTISASSLFDPPDDQ